MAEPRPAGGSWAVLGPQDAQRSQRLRHCVPKTGRGGVTVAGGVAESQAAAAVCRKPPPSAGPVSPPFTNKRTQGSGVRRQGSEATSPLRSVFGECPCGRPHSLV